MSNLLPYQSKPRIRRPLAAGEIVSWGIIVVVVSVILILPYYHRWQLKARAAAQAVAAPTVEVLIEARYAFGANILAKDQKKDLPDLSDSVEKSAKTSWDLFRAAILRAELDGGPAGLIQLKLLEKLYPELHHDVELVSPIYQNNASTTLPASPDWKEFSARHGWFADLALSYHQPDDSPLRSKTISAALRTLFASLGFLFVAAIALLAGLVLFIIAMVRLAQRKVTLAFPLTPGLPADRRIYLESFAWYLGCYLGLAFFGAYVLKWSGFWTHLPLLLGVTIALLWPVIQAEKWPQYRALLGLHTGRGVLLEICYGVLGYLVGLPVFALGAVITAELVHLSGANAAHPVVQEVGSGEISWPFLFFVACVWAPITEELLFRGALFGHLRERFGWWLSALPVALIFAGIHPQGWAAIPALASLALILAAIREWRSSIISSMTAHSLNNGLTLLFLYLAIS